MGWGLPLNELSFKPALTANSRPFPSYKRGEFMHTYKLYVTDMTKAYNTLLDAGYECEPKNTFLEVKAEENQKMDIIKKINAAHIVMLDIE